MTRSTSVTMRSEAGIGYVQIDFPPVNAIGQDVRRGLLDAAQWAESNQLALIAYPAVS